MKAARLDFDASRMWGKGHQPFRGQGMRKIVGLIIGLALAGCSPSETKFNLTCTEVVPAGGDPRPVWGEMRYKFDLQAEKYCVGECANGPLDLELINDDVIVASSVLVTETFFRQQGRLRISTYAGSKPAFFDCKRSRFTGFPKPAF